MSSSAFGCKRYIGMVVIFQLSRLLLVSLSFPTTFASASFISASSPDQCRSHRSSICSSLSVSFVSPDSSQGEPVWEKPFQKTKRKPKSRRKHPAPQGTSKPAKKSAKRPFPRRHRHPMTAEKKKRQETIAFNKELQEFLKQTNSDLSGVELVKEAQNRLLARIENSTASVYDTVSFNIVLQAWARQHCMMAARAADELLSSMFPLQVPVDSYSYAAVLHGYAKSGGKLVAARRAQELLDQWQSNPASKPLSTDICHNLVMDAWAASGDSLAGERAEALLRQLQSKATRISYNACIKAYGRTGRAVEARRLLNELLQTKLMPDKISYTTCIDALAKQTPGSKDAALKAEVLLLELERDWQNTGDESLRPDIVSYTAVLTTYAKAGMTFSLPNLLDRMQQHAQPNAAFLNAWINLLSKASSSTETDARVADEVLKYMQNEYEQGNDSLRPCVITYTAVISVLAHAGTKESAHRAEELLNELEELWRKTGDVTYLPNAKTFASVLNVFAKSKASGALKRADKLLIRMNQLYEETKSNELRPNLVVYSQLFQVLASIGDVRAAGRARELLDDMNRLHDAGVPNVQPDAATYAYLVNTYTKSGVKNAAELASQALQEVEDGYRSGNGKLKPTELLYSAVLQAFAKSASCEGVRLAEELLERTKDMYKQGKLYAKPTALYYNAVMDSLARSHGGEAAAMRAEELLNEMERRGRAGDSSLLPKTRSFNAAILAWKNSHAPDAPDRAESLLKRLNDRYKKGDIECRPCRVTLNSIIAVWAKCRREGAADRAHQYLCFMMHVAHERHDDAALDRREADRLMPDAFSFNSCIDAYARSSQPNAVEKATEVFEMMIRLYQETCNENLKPNVITLTSLRNAWSRHSAGNGRNTQGKRIQKLIKMVESSGRKP